MPPAKPRPCTFYDGSTYDMADSLGHMLVLLISNVRREVESRMTEHGLTDAQWKPLWFLKQGRGDTTFELARVMSVDAGAMTRTIDRLVAKGLVDRVRSETDRRVVHLRLTPRGEEIAAQVPHVLAAVNNDFLQGFSKQEWMQLQQMLKRMLATGQAMQIATEAEQ